MLIHLPIRWLLPKYDAAIEPGMILVLATFFPIVSSVPATVLVSLGAQRRVVAIRAFAAAVAATAIFSMIAAGRGFAGVAVGTSLGFAVQALLMLAASTRATGLPRGRAVGFGIRMLLPWGALILLLAGVFRVVPDVTGSPGGDLAATAVRGGIVALLTVPWALRAARKFGLIS